MHQGKAALLKRSVQPVRELPGQHRPCKGFDWKGSKCTERAKFHTLNVMLVNLLRGFLVEAAGEIRLDSLTANHIIWPN